MDETPAALPLAELVIRNGRQQGVRRALRRAITIVGSTKGCDVRLEVDSVRPIHCVIALGSDGPQLRSWGADDTLVNGAPVLMRALRDGDVLRVGPFEFEICWTAPLAEPVAPPPPALPEEASPWSTLGPNPTDEKIRRLEDLQRQLGEARASFRRERTDFETDSTQHLRALAEARDEMEKREDEVGRQGSRLKSLRGRFIKRWKRHWSTQRELLKAQVDQCEIQSARFEDERAAFEAERSRFEDHREVETRRIEHGWEQLRAAERNLRNERARHQAAQDQREMALVDQQARLKSERLALRAERMQVEHHSAQLRIEADGMESRVVNLRAVLLQLEERRVGLGGPHGNSTDATPAVADKTPTDADLEQRRKALDLLAEELNDQRLTLAEQVNLLAEAREAWREEESHLVEEMTALAEQLRRRDDQLAENEKAIGFERDALEQDAAALKHLRERLEVRQARLESIESDWRSELGGREVGLQQRRREIERREQALHELCRRWSERRRHEVVQLRDEHRRCELLRSKWTEQIVHCERREQALEERQVELAAGELVLAKAREQLLEATGRSDVAIRRLERLGRHVRASRACAEARLAQRQQVLAAERGELNGLGRRIDEKIEEAAIKQRLSADRLAELERREYFALQSEMSLAETKTVWTSQREMLERERDQLRHELDRLAVLLIDSDEYETVPLARAA